MGTPLFEQSWSLQIPEPAAAGGVARIGAQEEYLGCHLVPWLFDQPRWLAEIHSYHAMRYLDPTHLGAIRGIVVVLRFVGEHKALAAIEQSVTAALAAQLNAGVLAGFEPAGCVDWSTSVLPEYGGSDVAIPWASFLAASTTLGLLLARDPTREWSSRSAIAANWFHCFGLITRGIG